MTASIASLFSSLDGAASDENRSRTGSLINNADQCRRALVAAGNPARVSERVPDRQALAVLVPRPLDLIRRGGGAPKESVGKATGKDAARGKATLVGVLGLDEAKAERYRLAHAAVMALAGFGHEADTLRDAARFTAERRV